MGERALANPNLVAAAVIYLDTAHTYPEMVLEMEAAWEVLAEGGYLIGDDFDHRWAPVQQSVTNFVVKMGADAFEPPASYVQTWSHVKGYIREVQIGNLSEQLPLLTKYPSQWILKKPLRAGAVVAVHQASKSTGSRSLVGRPHRSAAA